MAHLRHRTYSILVGDDDLAVRESVVAVLARWPLHVFTAASGSDALRILFSRPIDFSILDVEMPGMTGIEVLQRYLTGPWIAAQHGLPSRSPDRRSMPTIFISGCRDDSVRQACERLGDSYLDKPFEADEMRGAVNRILSRLDS